MKMVKSLLLGSAAGVVAVAGAQAADLPVKAVAVQYVKICTLYGDGFYYIPGTDTCIKFGGYIRSDYNYNGRTPYVSGANGAQDRTPQYFTTRHRANFTSDVRTQTGYGTLRAFTSMNFDVAEGNTTASSPNRAYIQWGGFTFGRTASFIDHEGSIGDGGLHSLYTGLVDSTTGAAGINQIAYTWQLGGGVTLNVGADEPRSGSVTNMAVASSTIGNDPGSSRQGQTHPDPWVSLRVSQAWGRASIAAIGHENGGTYYNGPCAQVNTTLCGHPNNEWGWAVLGGAEIKLDMLSPGSRIGGYFTYGVGASKIVVNSQASPGLYGTGNEIAFGFLTDAVYVNGGSLQLTTGWAAGGGFEYFWTRNFSSTIYGGYTQFTYNNTVIDGRYFCGGSGATASGFAVSAATACNPGYSLWQVGTHHDWFPAPGFRLAVDVLYTGIQTAFEGQTVTISKTQGARPTGAYTARNLGTTSVMFRAQRDWGN